MHNDQGPRMVFHAPRARNWLERACFLLVAATVLVLGFFFLTVALAAGAVVALVILARWWWVTRALRRRMREQDEFIEGDYSVVERARLHANDPSERR